VRAVPVGAIGRSDDDESNAAIYFVSISSVIEYGDDRPLEFLGNFGRLRIFFSEGEIRHERHDYRNEEREREKFTGGYESYSEHLYDCERRFFQATLRWILACRMRECRANPASVRSLFDDSAVKKYAAV
jgi:hypothetical protein